LILLLKPFEDTFRRIQGIMKNITGFFGRFCALFLMAGALLSAPSLGRSQVFLTMTATDATYSNVTVTLSGTFSSANYFDLYYSNLLLVGLTNATEWSSTAGATTLSQSADFNGPLSFDTLAYNTTADPNTGITAAGAYLQAATAGDNDSSFGSPFDYSGTATFDLSSIAAQLGTGTGSLIAEIQSADDNSFSSQIVGTWSLAIVSAPEPGTVGLSLFGGALALGFVLRRRVVAA
jgi:hypothetical protein